MLKAALVWLLTLVGGGLGYFIAHVVASPLQDVSRDALSRWPRVSGIITDSKVAINGRDEPPNWIFSIFFVTVRPHWDITVVFTYVVKGVQYAGEQRWYTNANDKTEAQGERLSYFAGKTVIVNYNPQNPTRAVIEPAKPTILESDVMLIAEVVAATLGTLGALILAWLLLGWRPW